MSLHEHYQGKAKRDARARDLKIAGKQVRRTSQRNVQLHPQYVEDYDGPLETGFGNTQYQTLWPVIYTVEEVERDAHHGT